MHRCRVALEKKKGYPIAEFTIGQKLKQDTQRTGMDLGLSRDQQTFHDQPDRDTRYRCDLQTKENLLGAVPARNLYFQRAPGSDRNRPSAKFSYDFYDSHETVRTDFFKIIQVTNNTHTNEGNDMSLSKNNQNDSSQKYCRFKRLTSGRGAHFPAWPPPLH